MKEQNCLIIVYSYHHHNTAKVASAMSEVLNADVKSPADLSPEDLSQYELIGFGAGIDSGKHYKQLLDFADSLGNFQGKKCFIFSTSAILSEEKVRKDHTALRNKLLAKDFTVIGEFSCKGFNTNLFLKYFGGMNKGRPNSEDLNKAKEFAKGLLKSI